MSKHLIIDGYNLLRVITRPLERVSVDRERQREAFLDDLSKYQQRLRCPMTVVFDAWRRVGNHHRQEHRTGLTVIFSRHGEQADHIIQRMARMLQEECVVVSSDHEVMNVARAHGALTIRAQEFLPKLRVSPTRLSHSENEDDFIQRDRLKKRGNPRKLKKSTRNRIKMLRKF